MDNVVTISNAKDNTLEFDVDIQGIETDDMAVRFVIETGIMDLGFDSEKGVKNKWSVKIPALSILDSTMYPFHINIVVDGYNFTPLQGSVNVVGTHEVYASNPENITLAPAKKKANKIVQSLNPKPVELGPPEPQQDTPPPKTPSVVKSEHKFEIKPLKVKDGQELFKTLMVKKPKITSKKDDKLDDKIVNLLKQTKKENITKVAKIKKPVARTVENPIIVATKEPKNETPKKVPKKTAAKKKTSGKKNVNVKLVAEKIIQSVTGLGKRQALIKNNPNDAKIKNIIKEDFNVEQKEKTAVALCAIKKIGKDNAIVEIDTTREQKIKNALKKDSTDY